jgi:hypothetical protein
MENGFWQAELAASANPRLHDKVLQFLKPI